MPFGPERGFRTSSAAVRVPPTHFVSNHMLRANQSPKFFPSSSPATYLECVEPLSYQLRRLPGNLVGAPHSRQQRVNAYARARRVNPLPGGRPQRHSSARQQLAEGHAARCRQEIQHRKLQPAAHAGDQSLKVERDKGEARCTRRRWKQSSKKHAEPIRTIVLSQQPVELVILHI